MTKEEALNVLDMIDGVYPTFNLTKKKGDILMPQLEKMDFEGVMKKLNAYIAENRFPPTIAEIAVFPPAENPHLEEMKMWEREAAKVPVEIKERFRKALLKLIEEKSCHET